MKELGSWFESRKEIGRLMVVMRLLEMVLGEGIVVVDEVLG